MYFCGFQIPECNVSFDALPSLLVEYNPNAFEGWEVVEDLEGTGYWFRPVGGRKVLMGKDFALVLALCNYVKCDVFVWSTDKGLSLHFTPDCLY